METKIIRLEQITQTVMSLILEKPVEYNYMPGQFINITIPVDECDARCNKRNFSLVSSPTDEYLQIATRRGVSRFKQTYEIISPGTAVKISPPLGKFTLNMDTKVKAVMLSGGIGITPLHSMLKYATVKKLPKQIIFIYSNSKKDDIPFKNDLDDYAKNNPHLSLYYAITDNSDHNSLNSPSYLKRGLGGVKQSADARILGGRIDEVMIKKQVSDFWSCEFYVCGPPDMVTNLVKMLEDMKIRPDLIKQELFTGY